MVDLAQLANLVLVAGLPAIPVDPLVPRWSGTGLELGADGVGDGDQRHLHHLRWGLAGVDKSG